MIIDGLKPLATSIEKLKLLPGNPRRGNIEAVAKSLDAFGQRKPIVALTDGTIIAGNHTLQAAQSLGWTEIAVVFVEDDEATAKAYALADNRTAELGDYDNQALADLISDVQLLDKELFQATGWNNDDLLQILADIQYDDVNALLVDGDFVPDSAPSKTIVGDVWLLGPHRVLCGDSTITTNAEKLMKEERADIIWTDPPYGVSYVGKTADALTIENDGSSEFEEVLCGALDTILSVSRPGAACYVAAPAGPAGVPFAVELLRRDLFRQRLAWVKSSMVLGHSDYHYRHEDIYFGYVPGATGRKGRGGVGWYGDNSQTSVLEFKKPSANPDHPTMKPIDLIQYCLKNSSAPSQLVFDPFGGSGSTLIAAHQLGRIARLIELDPRYVDVICRRWQEQTGIFPINEASGQEHDFLED
jgi:site-specific DNA-methyltransferase (adenine-specific)